MTTFWHRKTNRGRVVYDRKPTPFSVRDLRRIQRAVLENVAAKPISDEIAEILIFLLRELSEYMMAVILAPAGLSRFSPLVVEMIQQTVDDIYALFDDYLKNARGPIGIPGPAV